MRVLLFLGALRVFAAFNLTWGVPAVNLDTNPPLGDTDLHAKVAIDREGNGAAVWSRTAGGGAVEEIWASIFNHTARVWSGPHKISVGNSTHPQVAIDPQGDCFFVWEEGFPTQIQIRTLFADGTWDSSRPLCESPHPQTCPQIGFDGRGNLFATWLEFSKDQTWIYASVNGENPVQIGPGIFTSYRPLAINDQGDAAIVWSQNGEIFCSKYENKMWGAPNEIGFGTEEAMALSQKGDIVVVWNQEGKLQARVGNRPSQTIFASDFPAGKPDIGIDAQGQAVIVFERTDAMSKFIASTLSDATLTTWTKPIDISGPSSLEVSGAGYPLLSLNPIGDGVAIWKEAYEGIAIVQAAGYSIGTWAPAKNLSPLNGKPGKLASAYDIGIALNLTGNVLAIWPEDATGYGTSQIKATLGAGIANVAPMPPIPILATETVQSPPKETLPAPCGYASGYQVYHRFAAHGDLINILDWISPGNISYFRVYRGSLRHLIGTTTSTHFEDHQRTSKKKETYLITSVDEHEQESVPITILVH
jgi:hypothetical protein